MDRHKQPQISKAITGASIKLAVRGKHQAAGMSLSTWHCYLLHWKIWSGEGGLPRTACLFALPPGHLAPPLGGSSPSPTLSSPDLNTIGSAVGSCSEVRQVGTGNKTFSIVASHLSNTFPRDIFLVLHLKNNNFFSKCMGVFYEFGH